MLIRVLFVLALVGVLVVNAAAIHDILIGQKNIVLEWFVVVASGAAIAAAITRWLSHRTRSR